MLRRSGGLRRVAVFGVSYAIGSLSCTLAVFLAVIGQTLTAANPLQLIAVFVAYAAGSATVLIALSVSAALAKGALARAVRRLAPAITRVAGTLLVASGAYLILYWLPTLRGEAVPDSGVSRFSQRSSTPGRRSATSASVSCCGGAVRGATHLGGHLRGHLRTVLV